MFLNFIHNHGSNNKLLLERKTPHTRRAQSSKTINTEGLQEVKMPPTHTLPGQPRRPWADGSRHGRTLHPWRWRSARSRKRLVVQSPFQLSGAPLSDLSPCKALSHVRWPSHSPCLALPWFYTERNGKGRTEEINTHVNAGGRYMFSNRRMSTGNNCSGFPTHVETLTIAIMILLGVVERVEPATQNRISIKAYLVWTPGGQLGSRRGKLKKKKIHYGRVLFLAICPKESISDVWKDAHTVLFCAA